MLELYNACLRGCTFQKKYLHRIQASLDAHNNGAVLARLVFRLRAHVEKVAELLRVDRRRRDDNSQTLPFLRRN